MPTGSAVVAVCWFGHSHTWTTGRAAAEKGCSVLEAAAYKTLSITTGALDTAYRRQAAQNQQAALASLAQTSATPWSALEAARAAAFADWTGGTTGAADIRRNTVANAQAAFELRQAAADEVYSGASGSVSNAQLISEAQAALTAAQAKAASLMAGANAGQYDVTLPCADALPAHDDIVEIASLGAAAYTAPAAQIDAADLPAGLSGAPTGTPGHYYNNAWNGWWGYYGWWQGWYWYGSYSDNLAANMVRPGTAAEEIAARLQVFPSSLAAITTSNHGDVIEGDGESDWELGNDAMPGGAGEDEINGAGQGVPLPPVPEVEAAVQESQQRRLLVEWGQRMMAATPTDQWVQKAEQLLSDLARRGAPITGQVAADLKSWISDAQSRTIHRDEMAEMLKGFVESKREIAGYDPNWSSSSLPLIEQSIYPLPWGAFPAYPRSDPPGRFVDRMKGVTDLGSYGALPFLWWSREKQMEFVSHFREAWGETITRCAAANHIPSQLLFNVIMAEVIDFDWFDYHEIEDSKGPGQLTEGIVKYYGLRDQIIDPLYFGIDPKYLMPKTGALTDHITNIELTARKIDRQLEELMLAVRGGGTSRLFPGVPGLTNVPAMNAGFRPHFHGAKGNEGYRCEWNTRTEQWDASARAANSHNAYNGITCTSVPGERGQRYAAAVLAAILAKMNDKCPSSNGDPANRFYLVETDVSESPHAGCIFHLIRKGVLQY